LFLGYNLQPENTRRQIKGFNAADFRLLSFT